MIHHCVDSTMGALQMDSAKLKQALIATTVAEEQKQAEAYLQTVSYSY